MMPSRYLATGKDTIFLYLIEEERATIYDVLELNHQQQTWCYQYPYHRCPLEKCFVDEITHHIQLCAVCETTLTNWVQIFSLSAIIAGQYLAVQRYEERRETSIHSRPRARNEKKSKRFVSTHTYKVIDANEILIPLHPADEDHIHHSETEKEGRFSWVAQAYVEGDLDRRVITTRPFTRTYRSERYVNVRGQTQDFPEGIIRQQPIRKSRQGKRITKVKASDYEEE